MQRIRTEIREFLSGLSVRRYLAQNHIRFSVSDTQISTLSFGTQNKPTT